MPLRNTDLYIIVSNYPYGYGEPFLEYELWNISKLFNRIYLVLPEADSVDKKIRKFPMPPNIEVELIHNKIGWIDKIISFSLLFKNEFWEELNIIKNHYNLVLTYDKIKLLLASWSKAKQLLPHLQALLRKNYKGSESSIFYSYWGSDYAISLAMLKKHNKEVKCFTRLHGWDLYFERHENEYLPLRKYLFNQLDLVLTISHQGRNYLINKIPIKSADLIVNNYLGTDYVEMVPFNKETGKLRILTLAFISPVKNLQKFIESLNLINDILISWTHIGGGTQEDEIVKIAQKILSPQKNITYKFLGDKLKHEVYSILRDQHFDVLVNTSISEGLPVSMMECTSYGIPIIASDVGGISEILKDDVNGFLLPTNATSQQFADALNRFSDITNDKFQSFRRNSRKIWEENFNGTTNSLKLHSILTSLTRPRSTECSKCILTSIDYPEITFDQNGICNICHTYDELASRTILKGDSGFSKLENTIKKIKEFGKGKQYDCLIGISGGVDSTFLSMKLKEWGLRPLVLHVDNGWNSELSVNNVENIINTLGYDLITDVINWKEMKDLQQSFMKASVLDIDLPTDNVYFASMIYTAAKYDIKYIITGHNTATEGYLPPNFTHFKLDSLNLRAIHKLFGSVKLKTIPQIGIFRTYYYLRIKGIKIISPLDWIEYNKTEAKKEITEKLGWRDYGGKHYENIFTRFYQGYILKEKFGVDKRKSHLSTLICSGQITKEQALLEMQKSAYDSKQFKIDYDYFLKKMEMTEVEFNAYMKQPIKKHTDYPSYINYYKKLSPYVQTLRNIKSIFLK